MAPAEREAAPAPGERPGVRLFVLRVLVVAVLVTLFGRLWFLQVHEADSFTEAATENRVRGVVTTAPRGDIYDATGRRLVRNRTALVVAVNRSQLLREPKDGKDVLARLAAVVGLPAADISQLITPCGGKVVAPCHRGSPYQPVTVAAYAATDKAGLRKVLSIEEHREDFPGVTIGYKAVREYEGRSLAGHVLGYLGPISDAEKAKPAYADYQGSALVGRDGVETTYDRMLRGKDGLQRLIVDKNGAVTGEDGEVPYEPGQHLVLSIDAKVQKVAEDALNNQIAYARTLQAREGKGLLKADSGSVIVMEARTGRLVAMASYPAYDPTEFANGITDKAYRRLTDPAQGAPLIFRATQGGYAPASTFKVVSTAAAVNGGNDLRGTYACPGVFAPTGQTNFEAANLGSMTLHTSLVRSCDTIYYKFAYDQWNRDGGIKPQGTPKEVFVKTAQSFGLGRRTGVDLPGEAKGRVADRAFKKAFWQATRDNYCKGAKNMARSPQRRADNQDHCTDGHLLRGGEATNFSIGQGDTVVTPLQLATVYAAVANGGSVVQPTVGRALLSADGRAVTQIPTRVRGKAMASADTLAFIRSALAGVTQPGGTAGGSFSGFEHDRLAVAGKTGTAQVNGKQDTSWFASFAPAAAPQLVVVAMVSQGGTGGTTAGPIVRKVYEGIYGLAGRPAAMPGGMLPAALPFVRGDGSVAPPGTRQDPGTAAPAPRPTKTPAPTLAPAPAPRARSAPASTPAPTPAPGVAPVTVSPRPPSGSSGPGARAPRRTGSAR